MKKQQRTATLTRRTGKTNQIVTTRPVALPLRVSTEIVYDEVIGIDFVDSNNELVSGQNLGFAHPTYTVIE